MTAQSQKVKLLITGATGLVGRAMVKAFSASPDLEIYALGRNPELLEKLTPKPAGTICCDITDSASLERELLSIGFDAVIHAAGFVSPNASRQEIFAVNVDGTKNLLEICGRMKVRQFVFISSLSVITGREDCFDLDESAPLRTSGEAYGDSKVEAEKLVTAGKHNFAWTVLRPGFIYGPGERAWLPRVIDSIKSGRAVLVDGGFRLSNVVYAENLGTAAVNALFNEKAYGQVFNITDPEKVTKKQLFNAIADGLGCPPIGKQVPRWLLNFIVSVVAAVPALATRLPFLSRAAFRLTSLNQGFSTAKAERLLNYNSVIPFKVGMRRTMDSFSAQRVKAGEVEVEV